MRILQFRLAPMLVLTVAASGCMGIGFDTVRGSGKVITETRTVSGFTGVAISGDAKVVIEPGDTERVEITADDNLMEYLTAEVSGSKLELGQKNLTNLSSTERITYHVFVKSLKSIESSGSASIEAKGLRTDSLSVAVSGSGEIDVSGEAAVQDIAISGSASYDAEDLSSKSVTLAISGSGNAVLAVSEKLDVQVSGSGGVEYIGNPQVTKNISGSGSVRQR